MIRVEPITEAWADALAEGDDVFSQRFDVAVENDWAGFPEVVPFLVRVAHSTGALSGGRTSYSTRTAPWSATPVGKESRWMASRSWATQSRLRAKAVESQPQWCSSCWPAPVAQFLKEAIAHTLPEQSPSISVLARCGFRKADDVIDPEDGPVWRWTIRLVER